MPLQANQSADVVIVGGGIAGVVTAYFTLRNTDNGVLLLEADKIAHGATGHNAGQITSYFERPFSDIVREFGLTLAAEGQKAVESGWLLLDEIYGEAGLQTPLYRFTGYAGLSSLDQALLHLENNRCRVDAGLVPESMVIAEEWPGRSGIPPQYKDLYTLAPHHDLQLLLETKSPDYIASLSYQKGCMNSALFSEELIGYLIVTYQDRFRFYEGSPVKTVRLKENRAALEALTYTVDAERVVLCTNGFENFIIINEAGADIDTKFHHLVEGYVGYMAGYIEPLNSPPTAISYFPRIGPKDANADKEVYFYLTRRPHEHERKESYNLVCTGGPEKELRNPASYSREEACEGDMREVIDRFLHENYRNYPGEQAEYIFCWHGLMAYTPNGIRRIGLEPRNPVLLYNLGCNGVGILPSLYGGKRISQFLRGETMEPSIFDPQDQRSDSGGAA